MVVSILGQEPSSSSFSELLCVVLTVGASRVPSSPCILPHFPKWGMHMLEENELKDSERNHLLDPNLASLPTPVVLYAFSALSKGHVSFDRYRVTPTRTFPKVGVSFSWFHLLPCLTSLHISRSTLQLLNMCFCR